ncbi:protein of unknown function [Mucilaginibacter mallensis]|uniref:DUF4296 domain-containing protein n=1 Tax=Mucilaginibacter mallensis TaxID=652787 RepID=A0A1H1UBL8_MUCMA|nr:DUF4296 domain-containing protein [Mucilaginibacter mallensis]SDS69885.1 protein of unknown function [Mucilaginibacter mallensis]
MRKYITLFFLVLLFLSACSNGTPDGIIDKDNMIALLTDVHIVDGTLITVSQTPDTLYKYGRGKYQAVFAKHHTDSAQFRKSFIYYASNKPVELADMYDKVLENLRVKTDSITKLSIKQNTVNSKKTLVPGTPGAGAMPAMQAPVTPVQHNNVNPRARFEKMQAHRDSLIRKQRNKNASPAK